MDPLIVFILILVLISLVAVLLLHGRVGKAPVVDPETMKGAIVTSWRELGIDEDIGVIKTRAEDILVQSQSGNGNYHVALIEGEWRCECPDFQFRKVVCKHIHAVRFWLALRKKIEKSSMFSLGEEVLEAKHCRFCGSPMIIKQGTRKCRFGFKQVYLCKDCGKKFVPERFCNIYNVSLRS